MRCSRGCILTTPCIFLVEDPIARVDYTAPATFITNSSTRLYLRWPIPRRRSCPLTAHIMTLPRYTTPASHMAPSWPLPQFPPPHHHHWRVPSQLPPSACL